jgi:hypothetical protein
LAKPNYQFEKRQRDLAKKNKQEEKRRQKLLAKNGGQETGEVLANNPGSLDLPVSAVLPGIVESS